MILEVHYHPSKANVVADALSRKSQCNCLSIKPLAITLCQEMEKMNLGIIQHETIANLILESTIQSQIIDAQRVNKGIAHIKEKVEAGKAICFRIDENCVLWFHNRLVEPKVPGLLSNKYWTKLICLGIPFIQEAIRCIKI
jgi:hypothetical protein